MPNAGTKIGSRGCPKCGGHNTQGITRGGGQFCLDCDNRWIPCRPHCRGYEVTIDDVTFPTVSGCKECGVPDKFARWWPEAYRTLHKLLAEKKLKTLNA